MAWQARPPAQLNHGSGVNFCENRSRLDQPYEQPEEWLWFRQSGGALLSAVYSFAARLTDDPRDANDLTRAAFRNTRRQLTQLRNQTAIATILISAVIRAGLGSA